MNRLPIRPGIRSAIYSAVRSAVGLSGAGGGGGGGDYLALPGTPSGVFSMCKRVSGYGGHCVRIERSSDSTSQDFGFVASALGSLVDAAAIATFIGGGYGRVTRWYDQARSGHYLQTDPGGYDPARWHTSLALDFVAADAYPFLSADANHEYITTTAGTVGAVATLLANTGSENATKYANDSLWQSRAGYHGVNLLKSSGKLAAYAYDSAERYAESTVAFDGSTVISTWWHDGTNVRHTVDGSTVASAACGTIGTAMDKLGVGRYDGSNPTLYREHELVLYATALDATDRAALRAAQAAIWTP